jgi:hydroxylamine reductase
MHIQFRPWKIKKMDIFCYQCEETAKGTGYTVAGVCGKDACTATLQDLLIYATKGIGMYAHRAGSLLERTKSMYEAVCAEAGKSAEALAGPAKWRPDVDIEGLVEQGQEIGITHRQADLGEDVVGLQKLITYAIKGAAAYVDHAQILGKESREIYAGFHETLDYLSQNNPTVEGLFDRAMKTGKLSLKAMELLDAANTEAYGHPESTQVRVTPIADKAILVSGHDLNDLDELLKQTKGKGINVYTHGEMLPCLAYPGLKRYKHLVGNYGGAWYEQRKEFDEFSGAIVMTTNCIQKPKDSYKDRIFTTGLVAWPDVVHIGPDRNFAPVIDAALAAPGFTEDAPEKNVTIGFGHHAVLGVADKVVDAVKSGAIKHFFLVGGCDGRYNGRSYYTDFVKQVPEDCVILTLACGKYRFNKLNLGQVNGIPRLLDMGQCNDAHSAIRVAEAFECDVNDLPLSLIVSWYEQKAVTVLLALLSLGIKNIKLGPRLPAFVTPSVLKILVDRFQIAPITTPEEDLRAILQD